MLSESELTFPPTAEQHERDLRNAQPERWSRLSTRLRIQVTFKPRDPVWSLCPQRSRACLWVPWVAPVFHERPEREARGRFHPRVSSPGVRSALMLRTGLPPLLIGYRLCLHLLLFLPFLHPLLLARLPVSVPGECRAAGPASGPLVAAADLAAEAFPPLAQRGGVDGGGGRARRRTGRRRRLWSCRQTLG